ncbi:MAG: sulfatase [Planctomycetaceae bacterium]|nr:sulfatase [Planctomycetaceae bacterium]|tara:strand:- start:1735 stop:3075 length:1341 start_codon:yes stop_codon:yes gene_type:complete
MNKLLFALLLSVASLVTAQARQPNVILIYTDDQGTIDVNCYGAKDLATPHMDGLAARGVKFTQFYSAAPVCSPSRAAVITGRYPQRAQIPGNVSSHHGHAGMPASQITMAEIFKAAGYKTAHIGKWHLGYDEATMPNNQGFDYSFGHMGGCIDNYSHFFYWNGPNRHDLWRNGNEIWRDGRYFPQLMVDEASSFIETNQERPFFIYFAMNIPHYPLQGTEKWRQHYQSLEAPRRMYATLISTMDEMIGKLIAKIETLGLREDTIIVFQSDHGHSQEERTFGGGGSAGIYRGAKFSLFEGGIRVPAIISWPGQLPEGESRDQLATAVDWFPTIAELAGIKKIEHRIDGKNITDLIHSSEARSPHKVFHWQTGGGNNPPWAVRKGDWKLMGNPRDTSKKAPLTADDKLFLANLSKDPTEMKNFAKDHPELVTELLQLHQQWVRDVKEQ